MSLLAFYVLTIMSTIKYEKKTTAASTFMRCNNMS